MRRRDFIIGAGSAAFLGGCSVDDSAVGPAPEDDDVDDQFTPLDTLITRWAADEYALGSYSYLAVGSSTADRDELRADVGDRLFFAGEATSADYAATVHGAVLEGRSAAQRVADVADRGDRIVVVGAGAAGLAAARALADDGYDVLIIEARTRIGGRVVTDDSLGVSVDLGASWIHGDDGNPVSALAEAAAVEQAVTDPDDIVVYDRAGLEVDDGLLDELAEALADVDGGRDDVLADLAEQLTSGLGDEARMLFGYLVTSIIEHEEAADMSDLTIGSLEAGEEFGGAEIVFPNGYSEVLAPLAEGLEIQLDRPVRRIDRTDSGARIEFAGGEWIDAGRVLVTVPLGVLKAGHIHFEPPLPDAKLEAIGRLGMGVLDKVVLRFAAKFWDDSDVIGFVGLEPGLFVEWYDLSDLVGEPVIMGFNAGRIARDLETRPDHEIIEAALDALRAMYG